MAERAQEKARLKGGRIAVHLGFLSVEGNWEPDDSEAKASWEMYVELITRISVVGLGDDEGLLREALTSLYSLFATTRKILRDYGPGLAIPKGDSSVCFGFLAVKILNEVLRPFLAKWHPLLLDYENSWSPNVSVLAHEQSWKVGGKFREELKTVQGQLMQYAGVLADVCGVRRLFGQSSAGPLDSEKGAKV